ncbi:MAG: hypothetical protein KKA05_04205 [Alphaproteobacteria bacterium]|nr:hypothetical protein [Alphaproteobacteria bacterium]MBU0858413.1 hypothetical protein [Alphaproteobacteria bacterium]
MKIKNIFKVASLAIMTSYTAAASAQTVQPSDVTIECGSMSGKIGNYLSLPLSGEAVLHLKLPDTPFNSLVVLPLDAAEPAQRAKLSLTGDYENAPLIESSFFVSLEDDAEILIIDFFAGDDHLVDMVVCPLKPPSP